MPLNLTPAEQLLYSTLRITVLDQNLQPQSCGTGFIMEMGPEPDKSIPCLVTNNHVLSSDAPPQIQLTFHAKVQNETASFSDAQIPIVYCPTVIRHPDTEVDLCALPIAPAVNQLNAIGAPVRFITLPTDLIPEESQIFDAIEDVTMVGYPNGLWDEANNLPLIRRGITSTPLNKDFQGRKEFVVDMACFHGSSGSPVFLYSHNGYTNRKKDGSYEQILGGSRVLLVGILYGGPVRSTSGVITMSTLATFNFDTMLHLGYVIKASRIKELQQEVLKTLQ